MKGHHRGRWEFITMCFDVLMADPDDLRVWSHLFTTLQDNSLFAAPHLPLGHLVISAEDADLDDENSNDDVFSTIVLNGTAQCTHFGDRQPRSHVNMGGDQHGQVTRDLWLQGVRVMAT